MKLLKFSFPAVATGTNEIDLCINSFTSGRRKETPVGGKVGQLVSNIIDLVGRETKALLADDIIDAHLDMFALQRKEWKKSADEATVDNVTLLKPSYNILQHL